MDSEGALTLNSGWVQAQNMHNQKFRNRTRFLGTHGGSDKTLLFLNTARNILVCLQGEIVQKLLVLHYSNQH